MRDAKFVFEASESKIGIQVFGGHSSKTFQLWSFLWMVLPIIAILPTVDEKHKV